MHRTAPQLREDALAIWHAGVAAVRSDRLVADAIEVAGDLLCIGDSEIDLAGIERIAVVGAGKAGAGMAAGLEAALGTRRLKEKRVSGWINVPDDCVRELQCIHLHPARPAGLNEPTEAGVAGARQILQRVESLGPRDLCLCLISGGGSALLPAPIDGISLADKQSVTRFLSAAGANIEQLNTVRKRLSRMKGGGLARSCRAGRLISLIISDVLGDPLDIIASGPTVADSSTAADALRVLEQFGAREAGVPPSVFEVLAAQQVVSAPFPCEATNLVIGNNAMAVDAAGVEAERRGYSHAMVAARQCEGWAEDVGRHLAEMALRMRHESGPDCLITGGEPVVQLAAATVRGKGGRNQQLVLAALQELLKRGSDLTGIVLLSGGTDGEDGPTDAAGAIIGPETVASHERLGRSQLGPEIEDHLVRNDAWSFFGKTEELIRTGPTHTNVCDIRVVCISRP